MSYDWKKEYNEKTTTQKEAVKCVKSGDRIYAGTASSVAYGLLDGKEKMSWRALKYKAARRLSLALSTMNMKRIRSQ